MGIDTKAPKELTLKEFPNCYRGHQYAVQIIEGKILACRYMIGTCERYLKDLKDPRFTMRWEKAERYLKLVQQFPHVIGTWKSENIVYMPWQKFVWMNIIGFYSNDSKQRRFRLAHLEIARGGAKSTMSSQAALYFLALDNPKGNQISTVATRKEQARIVLDAARSMAKKATAYRATTGVRVQAHQIIQEASDSKVRALSADASGLDGLQDILAICDELHAMKRETFDVIYSGMSKRNDSLTLCITTAGFDIDSVGYSQSSYAKKVAIGEVDDEQFFSAVFTLDEGDDIFEEANWIKANPGYGDSVDALTFKAKAKKAMTEPSDVANFKVKHLNMWLSEANAFFDLAKWDECADTSLRMEDFKGEKCYVAIDVASKVDLASVAYIFERKGIYYFFERSYIPEETVKKVKSDLYVQAIANGQLISTPGEAIQYDRLKEDIIANSNLFKFQDVLYDPWNAIQFSQDLTKEKLNMVEFRFTTANISEPTKSMDALIRQKKFRHNGSPLLRWCLGNVVCKYDAADNVFPKKTHERLKIDPVIAGIMALAATLQNKKITSIYEKHGIRSIGG